MTGDWRKKYRDDLRLEVEGLRHSIEIFSGMAADYTERLTRAERELAEVERELNEETGEMRN